MNQTQAFLDVLGDDWLERNRDALGKKADPVMIVLDSAGADLKGQSVLEIGCSNGWRLRALREKYDCEIWGIDPSADAVREASRLTKPASNQAQLFWAATAQDTHSLMDFDVVILGYCMWVIPPEDWFRVVAETDRILKNGGLLLIHDSISARAFKRRYAVMDNGDMIYQFYYDWTKLWLSNPGYKQVAECYSPKDAQWCGMLRKDYKDAIPYMDDA